MPNPAPTGLYHIYDGADGLLYIGVSKHFGVRWQQHAQKQPWWNERRRMTVDFYDTRDEEQTSRVYDAYGELVMGMAAEGYGLYRTNLRYMDLVAEQYDFNDHALRRFNETLKDALDPNGILSPGKQGIWPKSMRHGR